MTRSAAISRYSQRDVSGSIFIANGTTDNINIAGETTDPSTTDFTVSFFAMPTSLPKGFTPTADHVFYSQADGSGLGRSWLYIDRTNNKLTCFFGGVANASTFIFQNRTPAHIIFTRINSTNTFNYYVNGIAQGSFVQATGSATGAHHLMNNKTNVSPIYGGMTEVRFWTRVLTATEITNYSYSAIEPSSTSLRYQLNFTDGSGTTVTDSSGNGRHGTLTGGAWSTQVPYPKRSTTPIAARTLIGVARSLA